MWPMWYTITTWLVISAAVATWFVVMGNRYLAVHKDDDDA